MNLLLLQVIAVWLSLLSLFSAALVVWCVWDSIRWRWYGATVGLVLACGPLLFLAAYNLITLWAAVLK